jgi:hypothetical protein
MPYTNFNWIDENLAIGGRVDDYTDLPFDAVLCVQMGGDGDDLVPPTETTLASLEHAWVPMTDGPTEGCLDRFEQTAVLLEGWHGQGKRVLVHCYAGVSRSVSAVIYYLMRTQGLSYEEALARIQTKRPEAFPNPGFVVALCRHEGRVLDEAVLLGLADGWRTLLRDRYAIEADDELLWRDMGWRPAPAADGCAVD